MLSVRVENGRREQPNEGATKQHDDTGVDVGMLGGTWSLGNRGQALGPPPPHVTCNVTPTSRPRPPADRKGSRSDQISRPREKKTVAVDVASRR